MKTKSTILSVAISVFGTVAFAQGLYVKADFAYGMPAGTQTMYANRTITATTDIVEPIHVSLGKGLDFSGAVGYGLNENLSIELNVLYHSGLKFTATENDQTRPRETVETLSGSYLGFAPMVKLSGEWLGLAPYAKFGFLGAAPSVKSNYTRTDNTKIISNFKESGNLSFGLISELGVEYALNDKLALALSFRNITMSYNPAKGELTEISVDGKDVLSVLTTSDKQTEYVKEIDNDINQLDGNPRKELAKKYPFSSTGISIGVKITI